jgi:hypothetical protein
VLDAESDSELSSRNTTPSVLSASAIDEEMPKKPKGLALQESAEIVSQSYEGRMGATTNYLVLRAEEDTAFWTGSPR